MNKLVFVFLLIFSVFCLQSCISKEKKEEIKDENIDSIILKTSIIDSLNQTIDSLEIVVANIKEELKKSTKTEPKELKNKLTSTKIESKKEEGVKIINTVKKEEPKIVVKTTPEKTVDVNVSLKDEPKEVKPVVLNKNFVLSTGSKLTIKGTSSLHDWEEVAKDFTCNISAKFEGSFIKFEILSFNVKAKSIISEKDLMNKKTYEALKAEKYPDITFKMTTPVDMDLNQETFKGTITGNLSMAGVTKTISVPVNGMKKTDNSFQISGSKKIKMTDYKMEPPTALMGSIKTGDEVTVNFTLNLQAK